MTGTLRTQRYINHVFSDVRKLILFRHLYLCVISNKQINLLKTNLTVAHQLTAKTAQALH